MSASPQRRVAITGAGGFLGRSLATSFADDGWEVVEVVRSTPRPGQVEWRPKDDWIDAPALEGIDAFVHLAGENIFGLWTDEKKQRIRESRVRGTRLVSRALAGLQAPPRTLVSASAVGYYGDGGEEKLTEDAPPGDDFLARVCVEWEQSVEAAADAGIRVVNTRFGVILDREGGALQVMLPAFRLGAGARLGSGRQWMSWIGRDDAVRAIRFVIDEESVTGPVNTCAPNPVRNEDFTRALAAAVHRPTLLAVPEVVLRTLTMGMGDAMLLASQRCIPAALITADFDFSTPTIEGALAAALDADRPE